MPTEIRAPLRRLQLDGLRACALYLQGMRYGAHPSVMPVLRDLGLVEERSIRGPGGRKLWFLLPAGRELLTETGMSEPREFQRLRLALGSVCLRPPWAFIQTQSEPTSTAPVELER